MTETTWEFQARQFANCNCSYGCPCQFNALPTYNTCQAVVGFDIEKGHHGKTRLDGLKIAGIFRWPGPIHEGKGEAAVAIDEAATPAQREALLRILSGQDTEPGATIFNVFASTLEKLHDPIFTRIDFQVDIDARKARLVVPGVIEARGEPILNPVTKKEHRVRIDMVSGFEYKLAEIGRGWAKTTKPIKLENADSYGQFAHIHLSNKGVVH
jgi:hypothetical protein